MWRKLHTYCVVLAWYACIYVSHSVGLAAPIWSSKRIQASRPDILGPHALKPQASILHKPHTPFLSLSLLFPLSFSFLFTAFLSQPHSSCILMLPSFVAAFSHFCHSWIASR